MFVFFPAYYNCSATLEVMHLISLYMQWFLFSSYFQFPIDYLVTGSSLGLFQKTIIPFFHITKWFWLLSVVLYGSHIWHECKLPVLEGCEEIAHCPMTVTVNDLITQSFFFFSPHKPKSTTQHCAAGLWMLAAVGDFYAPSVSCILSPWLSSLHFSLIW